MQSMGREEMIHIHKYENNRYGPYICLGQAPQNDEKDVTAPHIWFHACGHLTHTEFDKRYSKCGCKA